MTDSLFMELTDVSIILSMKGKGKSAGKGDSGKGATFNGHCSWCGRYGHRVRERRDYTLRICQKEEHQLKVKAKERVTLEKETSARTMSTAGFQKESLEEKDGKVVAQIALEVSMRLIRCHFNSGNSRISVPCAYSAFIFHIK